MKKILIFGGGISLIIGIRLWNELQWISILAIIVGIIFVIGGIIKH